MLWILTFKIIHFNITGFNSFLVLPAEWDMATCLVNWLPHTAVITQLALSLIKLCYSFSEVHFLHSLRNETVISHLFYDPKKKSALQ
jgi:hypothetical protein